MAGWNTDVLFGNTAIILSIANVIRTPRDRLFFFNELIENLEIKMTETEAHTYMKIISSVLLMFSPLRLL